MATYDELRSLFGEGTLRNKFEVGIVIAANNIAQNSTSESAERLIWAQMALNNPGLQADTALLVALAVNSTQDASTILNASDAAIQNAVDSAVPVLAAASTSGL